MASKMVDPRYCIQHSRFTKQDGWRLWDISLSLNGNIAVTGLNKNTHRTYLDVYNNVRHTDFRDKPKLTYSKEFKEYTDEERIYTASSVSFIDDDILAFCLGNKLEVFRVNKIEYLRSRRVNGMAWCMSVRERREIFIGFCQSNKITVYDVVDLNEIKSIILQGIQDDHNPFNMTVIADRIFVCVGPPGKANNQRSLIFEAKNGRILSELTNPTDSVEWYTRDITVCVAISVVAVLWTDSFHYKEDERNQIVFYSLLSENNRSFLIVEIESGVYGIRMFDRGGKMMTVNDLTGKMTVYDMAEVFTYSHFKEKLASTLQTDECTKLTNFFKIPKDQTDAILKSDRPSENLFLALEGRGILQPYSVERLINAFEELTINPFCCHLAEIFLNTRSPAFYLELIQKLEEKMSMVQTESEEKTRQLKAKTTEVEDLQKGLKELKKLQEARLKISQERDKFKVERDEGQLQLSSLQKELEASKNAKAETEKILKQTEELLQKISEENNEIKTELKKLQIEHSLGSMSHEEGRRRQIDIKKKVSADTTDDASSTTSSVTSKYLPESFLGDEFAKLLVKVSVKLNKSNCIMMATYFNLPESRIDLLQKESDMPGVRLFRLLKERNIISMYDVTELQEALSVLHLLELNETLVIPYQSHIDPLLYQKNKITRKEH